MKIIILDKMIDTNNIFDISEVYESKSPITSFENVEGRPWRGWVFDIGYYNSEKNETIENPDFYKYWHSKLDKNSDEHKELKRKRDRCFTEEGRLSMEKLRNQLFDSWKGSQSEIPRLILEFDDK